MRIRLQVFLSIVLFSLQFFMVEKSYAQCTPVLATSIPTLIPVGSNCTAPLNWGTVTVNVASGCSVPTAPTFVSAISGATSYNVNDLVPAGTDIVVTYLVFINDGTATTAQTLTFTVQVRDQTAPVLTGIPATITVTTCTIPVVAPTISDNCTTGIVPTYSDAGTVSTCNGGTIVRTWTATDGNNNTGTFSQTITVAPDTTPPSILPTANDLLIDCDPATATGLVSAWMTSHGGASATDCNTVTWMNTPTTPLPMPGCVGSAGALEVTFTAKDACNNISTTKAKIISNDNFPPVVSQQAQNKVVACTDYSVDLDNWLDNKGNATVTDACAGSNLTTKYILNGVVKTKAQVVSAFNDSLALPCQASVVIGSTTYNKVKGKIEVTFSFSDNCQNESTKTTATFAATDNLAPVFTTAPTTKTIECDTANNIVGTFTTWYNTHAGGVAIDECSVGVTYRAVPTLAHALDSLAKSQSLSCGNTATVNVKFFAKDECDNETAAANASFLVKDTKAPIFTTALASTTVNCTASLFPPSLNTNNASLQNFINTRAGGVAQDKCSNITWSFTWKDKLNNTGINTYPQIPSSGAGYPPCDWFVDVKFKVKDECNNTDSTTVRFAIKDQTPPVLTNTQPDVTVTCTTIPGIFDDFPGATDNCSSSIVNLFDNISNQNDNCSGVYKITRTWVAADACGNKSTYTRVITVIDNQTPIIAGVPADITVNCDAVPPIPKVVMTDGCDPKPDSVFTSTTTKGTDAKLCNFYNYEITRKWTSTDKCGNSTSKSYKITVKDDTAPTFTVPADLTIECFQANTSSVTGRPTLVIDNCDALPKIDSSDVVSAGSCNGKNTYTRTWKVSDACNNSLTKNQTIVTNDTRKPFITNAPADITLECGTALPVVPTLIVKDSCDSNPTIVYLQSTAPAACAGMAAFKREWIVTDNCGNIAKKTQNIVYSDTKKPTIVLCPSDITMNNTLGNCDATVALKAPVVTDDCGAVSTPYTQSLTNAIASSDPGNPDVIIEPILFSFSVPLNATTSAVNPTLEIKLNNVDAEATTEYFNIIGENNTFLGKTSTTSTQCGSGTSNVVLSASQLNAWGQDGTVTITLIPFAPTTDPPAYSINDICTNSTVMAKLDFTAISNSALTYQYSINNGTKVSVAPIASVTRVLPVGVHTVKYFVKDCNNNIDSCEYKVSVFDKEAPKMTAPTDQTYTITGTDCTVTKIIPAPTAISDNCGFGTGYTQNQPTILGDAFLTFNYNPNLLTYFANDKTFVFTGVTPNAVSGSAVLSVKLKADSDASGEHYTFLGEDNMPLGTTNFGDCSFVGTNNFSITTSQLNTWAADGQIVIKAISNVSFPISQAGTDPGINPCTGGTPVTANGQNDGVSYMTATLSYRQANPTYSTSGATNTAPTPLYQPNVVPQVTFNTGVTTVFYDLKDAAGNQKTVAYTVTVSDVTPPIAKCKSTVLEVNPTAAGPLTLALGATSIDNGSSDNCGIQSITVSPNVFNCGDLNFTRTVTLTVKDFANNTSTCTADVFIEVAKVKLNYSLGICGNDTLKLFAIPPGVNNNIVYNYLWTGPNNFSSNLQNPYIPNVNSTNGGTYKLSVNTLVANCNVGTDETIEIPIDNQPNTPTITSPNTKPCTNGELVLNTAAYTGKKVKYSWYKGIAPTGVLIDTTTVPSYSILNPTVGAAKYYVVVKVDGCTSNASASITANPENPPVAALTNPTIIEICEGENITLGTTSVGAGYKYQWSGPNGFESKTQFPMVIVGAKPINSGLYTLIVSSANGCESAPVTTTVNVKAKPKTPQIIANGLDCVGSNISLVSDVTGVSSYHWIKPDLVTEQVTTNNTLTINDLDVNSKGKWKLYVKNNGCNSDLSNIIDLKVNAKPNVIADYQSPACEGALLQLNGIAPTNSSFSWSGPNNFSSNLQNPTLPAVAGSYILVGIDQNGCSNFDDAIVDLKPKPEITAISSNAPVCSSGTLDVKLTPTVFPFDNTHAYQWTGPNQTNSTNQVLTLPNATAAQNGTYILQVISQFGCKSAPKSFVVDMRNTPTTPVIKGDITQKNCVGDNILLELTNTNDYVGTAISYKWNTPQGFISTTQPTLSIPSAAEINTGNYYLTVIVDGCESGISGFKKIKVNKIPAKPVVTLNTPICEGETLILNTIPLDSTTYEWIGPGGFTASTSNPTRPDVKKSEAQGFYKVKVITQGCASVFSDNKYLQVNEKPSLPIVKNSGPVCLSTPNANLTLSIEPSTAIPGATYTWYHANTNTVLNIADAALNFNITNFNNYTEGVQEFYAITTFNGCNSKQSIPTAVNMDKIPIDQAFAGDDLQVCDKESVSLNAQNPPTAKGVWEQTQGSSLVIVDPNLFNTKISSLVAGQNYTLQWKLSKGACKNYSFDEVKIFVNDTSVKAEAGDSIQVCAKTQTTLSAKALPLGTTGVWTQPSTQIGVNILNPTALTPTVTGLSSGNMYVFKWTISNAACKDYSSDDVYVFVDEPKGVAFAGKDFKSCGGTEVKLNASAVNGAIGKWTSLTSGVQVASPNDPKSSVKNPTIGVNKFVWTISTSTCGAYSKDTVLVTFESAVSAVSDNIIVPYAGEVSFNPTTNDIIPPSGFTFAVTKQPKHGKITVSSDYKINYQAENAYAGFDEMEYEICNAVCPDICSTTKIAIKINGGDDCTIPTIITPNDDQINDRWEIPCLVGTDFPGNSVTIYNQWGDVVFFTNNYANDWQGTYNGQPLPAATYFYKVAFGTDIKSGFLIIER